MILVYLKTKRECKVAELWISHTLSAGIHGKVTNTTPGPTGRTISRFPEESARALSEAQKR